MLGGEQQLQNRGGGGGGAYSSYPQQGGTAGGGQGYATYPGQAPPPQQGGYGGFGGMGGGLAAPPVSTSTHVQQVTAAVDSPSAKALAAGGIWVAPGPHRPFLTWTYLVTVITLNLFFMLFFDFHEIVDSSGYFAIQKQFLFTPLEWHRFVSYTFFIPSWIHLVIIVPVMVVMMRRLESHIGAVSLMDGYIVCSITAAIGSCLLGNARYVYVYGPMGAVLGILGVVHAMGLRTWNAMRGSAFERKQSTYRASTDEVARAAAVLIHLLLLSISLPTTMFGLGLTLAVAGIASVAISLFTRTPVRGMVILAVSMGLFDVALWTLLWENTVVPYRLLFFGYVSGVLLGSLIWSPEKDEADLLLPTFGGDMAGAMRGHSVRNRLSQLFAVIAVFSVLTSMGAAIWNWDHHDYDCQRIVRMMTLTNSCVHPTQGHVRTATDIDNLYDAQNLDLLERLVEQSARNRDIVRHMRDDEGMEAVVDRMSCKNRDVHIMAVSILGHLTRHHAATRERIAHLNGITPLINLLKTGDTYTRREAGRTLGNLALSDENEVHVAGLGGLEPLIDLLKSEDTTAAVVAADSLFNLAFNKANKQLIKTMGGLRPAIKACGRPEPSVQISVAQLLGNLAMDDANEKEIVRLGGVECLLKNMRDGTSEVQQHSTAALYVISFDEDSKKRIVKNDGVQILMHLAMTSIGSVGADITLQAVKVLSVLALDADASNEIGRAGGVQMLVRELDADVADTQMFAAKALRNLALNDDYEHQMVESGALTSFLRLANDGTNPEAQAIAAGALHVISFHEDHRHSIAALEGVEIAVKMCYSPNAEVAIGGVRILGQLCVEPEYAKLAHKLGGRSCLKDHTGNLDDATMVEEATKALKLLEIEEIAPQGQHMGSLDAQF